jgi:hypothetical protein
MKKFNFKIRKVKDKNQEWIRKIFLKELEFELKNYKPS